MNLYEATQNMLIHCWVVKSEFFNEDMNPDDDSEHNEKEMEESDEISDNDSSLDGYDNQTTTEAAISSAVDCIDRLFRISMKVRSPATRTGLSKGYSFTQIDEDTKLDLFDRFVDLRIDEKHIKHILQTYRPNLIFADDPALFLIARLGRANNLRRRQFAYWSQHKLNLVRRTGKEKAVQQRHYDQRLQAIQPQSISDRSRPTTATQLDRANVNLGDDTQSDISTVSMNISDNASTWGDLLVFPDPPEKYRSLQDLKEFECPYCFTVCSRRLLSPREWKAHVLKDLRPYVCTYETCHSGSQLYDSFGDWVNHELSQHGKKSVPNSVAATNFQDRRECPFCFESFVNWETSARHIATHLIRIALFALPKSTGVEVDQDDHSAISNEKATQGGLSESDSTLETASSTRSAASQLEYFHLATQSSQRGFPIAPASSNLGDAPRTPPELTSDITSRDASHLSDIVRDGFYSNDSWTCRCGLNPVSGISLSKRSFGIKCTSFIPSSQYSSA